MGSSAYVNVAVLTKEEELQFKNGTRAIFGNVESVIRMRLRWQFTPIKEREMYKDFEDFCYLGYNAFLYSKWQNFESDLFFEKIERPYDETRNLYMLIMSY